MNDASFGALLRRWRDRLSPTDAGITASTGRRAPGLRREELAQLAPDSRPGPPTVDQYDALLSRAGR